MKAKLTAGMGSGTGSNLSLKGIIKRGDPVLREQKRQLMIGFSIFIIMIALLYPFLEIRSGNIYPTIILLSGLSLPIINNLIAYRYIARPFTGRTVLENYLSERRNIKAFTILTAVIRGLASGLLIGCLFFSLRLDEVRLWVFRGLITLYVVDLGIIIRLWIIRFGRLVANLDYFRHLLYPEDEL